MRNILFFLLLLPAANCFAQQQEDCRDIIYLRNGSVFKGNITAYQADGEIALTTCSGVELRLPAKVVKKVRQDCPKYKSRGLPRPYSFRESGWYHLSRVEVLWGESGVGFGLQHSSGLKINRLLGFGLGTGIENLTPWDDDIDTYPVFAEVRGYLLAKRITPFYALGTGYAFTSKKYEDDTFNGFGEKRRGGWMAQAQIGYRIGNHCTVHLGLRFQRKTRNWQRWGLEGADKILQKRLDLGVGILL